MAFTVTLNNNGTPEFFGRKKMVTGVFVNTGGDTGGSVITGLRRVDAFHMTPNGAAVDASNFAINGTMPLTGTGTVVVVTTANATASFVAIGE